MSTTWIELSTRPPKAAATFVLRVLTQLVPVRQQDGGAMEYVRQRRLDELPAGDALDGL